MIKRTCYFAQTNTKVSMNANSIFSVVKFFLLSSLLANALDSIAMQGKPSGNRMAPKAKNAAEKEEKFTKVISKQEREKEKLKLARHEELKKLAQEKPQSIMRKRRLAAHRNKDASRKTFSNMKFDELMQLRNKKLAEKKEYKNKQRVSNCNESLIIFTERLIKLATITEEMLDDKAVQKTIADLMLDLAELYCEQQQWDKASLVFKEFAHINPGHEKNEYALYKGVYCLYQTIKDIDPERDQTKVKDTIELAQKFLDRKIFIQHRDEVSTIQTSCYEKLVEYELGVVNFYLKNNNLSVTQKRLDYVRKELLAKASSYTPQVLQYEITLAERKHDESLVNEKKLELAKALNIDIESLPAIKKPTYFFAMKF